MSFRGYKRSLVGPSLLCIVKNILILLFPLPCLQLHCKILFCSASSFLSDLLALWILLSSIIDSFFVICSFVVAGLFPYFTVDCSQNKLTYCFACVFVFFYWAGLLFIGTTVYAQACRFVSCMLFKALLRFPIRSIRVLFLLRPSVPI